MLKLNLKPEPRWLEIGGGVRVKVPPLDTAILRAVDAFLTADGMTPAQVADVMNRQPDTVKRFLAREKAHDAHESAQEQS